MGFVFCGHCINKLSLLCLCRLRAGLFTLKTEYYQLILLNSSMEVKLHLKAHSLLLMEVGVILTINVLVYDHVSV